MWTIKSVQVESGICDTLGEVVAQSKKILSQQAHQAAGGPANSATLISRIKAFFRL